MTRDHYDFIIIGGGPVGMALALALRGSGVAALLLEARGVPEKTEDMRPLALSHGSHLILQRLGVWQALPEVPGGRRGFSRLHDSHRRRMGLGAARAVIRKRDHAPAITTTAETASVHPGGIAGNLV